MPQPLILTKDAGCYRVPLFERSGLRVLFTTRRFNMAFEGGGRRKAYKALGLDDRKLVCSAQVHSDNIFIVKKNHGGRGAHERATAIRDNDALITNEPGMSVAVLTADCLSVILWSGEARAVAAIHAGWRGIHKKIIDKTIGLMARRFDVRPQDIMAVLGPSIRNCCYEVGKEFFDHFPGRVSEKKGRLTFDMIAEAERQLSAAGVRPERIYDTGICTCCAKGDFYSYRREGESAGRSMAVAEILAG